MVWKHIQSFTYYIARDLSIAEPSGGLLSDKVLPVGREVALDRGDDRIVVAGVDDGVSEDNDCRRARHIGRLCHNLVLMMNQEEHIDHQGEHTEGHIGAHYSDSDTALLAYHLAWVFIMSWLKRNGDG